MRLECRPMSTETLGIPHKTPTDPEGSSRTELDALMDIYRTDRSVYTPSDFLQWRESGTLELTPKFQRRDIWKTPAKSYFIDTLLRGMPIPPIYLRMNQQRGKLTPIREVVDGQQRVRAVLSFIDGDYRLSDSLPEPWKNRRFDQLKIQDQQRIHKSGFPSETFREIPDDEVLNVFARLNTYSVPLNDQELRNGKFFGKFKQTSYRAAYANLEFWRRNRIFGEVAIARMAEVELTSELLIAGTEGMQHKKKSISDYYKEWDSEYPTQARDEKRFHDIIGQIGAVCNGGLKDTEFHGVPLFYTLFCVVFHRMFGLPDEKLKTTKKPMTRNDASSLWDATTRLSDVVSGAREDPASVPKKFTQFAAASTGQTTNIEPRRIRFETLFKEAF
ncbi:MAG: DUF262 domain-containing protein [Planctomycetaceae bacterium]|nr:DUF262 domain-containing protein [Planctomycetaceae bacterium]